MNRHEGVNCNFCLAGNFRGRRYKCLICYDYDLCSACYDDKESNANHSPDHPMQCLLTPADYSLYYGGESQAAPFSAQSFTCPFCGTMGFTDVLLEEHVGFNHSESSYDVICPLCAAAPGGDANFVTDDLAKHLSLEHEYRTSARDLVAALDAPLNRYNARRTTNSNSERSQARGRRGNLASIVPFTVFSSRGLAALTGESSDPILDLVTQISGLRRSSSGTHSDLARELQQLQSQYLHHENYPRRPAHSHSTLRQLAAANSNYGLGSIQQPLPSQQSPAAISTPSTLSNTGFLLPEVIKSGNERSSKSEEKDHERKEFLVELLMSSLNIKHCSH